MRSVRPALSVAFMRALVMRRRVRAGGGEPQAVTLQELLALQGEASLVVLLMVLSILTALPLAGLGTVLSFAMFAIAWRWASADAGRARVPFESTLRKIALSPAWSERTLRLLAAMYAGADRWLHPRWLPVFHASWIPWWAAWIALMAAIIFLPLPLGNILPSLSLVLLCLAWMFRDGVACAAAVVVGAGALAYTVVFSHVAWTLGSEAWVAASSWLLG